MGFKIFIRKFRAKQNSQPLNVKPLHKNVIILLLIPKNPKFSSDFSNKHCLCKNQRFLSIFSNLLKKAHIHNEVSNFNQYFRWVF